MKISVWNLNGAFRGRNPGAWQFMGAELNADIAVVQEAFDSPAPWNTINLEKPHAHRSWGTAIATRGPEVKLLAADSAFHSTWLDVLRAAVGPGALVATEVDVPGVGPVILISIHARVVDGYSFMTVHAILNALVPLLNSRHGKHVLIAGDFNNGDQIEPTDKWHRQLVNLWERFPAAGLVDVLQTNLPADRGRLDGCMCGQGDSCRHVRTQRFRNDPASRPFHTDHVWATPSVAEAISSCSAVDSEDAWALSDHCPVVLTLG